MRCITALQDLEQHSTMVNDIRIVEDSTRQEKGIEHRTSTSPDRLHDIEASPIYDIHHNSLYPRTNALQRWAYKLEGLAGVEARGIERVPESLRAKETTFADYAQIALIWFSANITANNLTLGLLGPLAFDLGLTDAMLIGTFGTLLGAIATSYIATFGPASGNRTLVVARYTMGWWPSRLAVLLNIVIMLGYGLIDSLLCGQILSAVAGGTMTVIVGTIVASTITLLVTVFGIRLFHVYERYAFVPQVLVLFVLVGVAGPKFGAGTASGGETAAVLSADKLSFFFLAASVPLSWAPAACDFFVYFPPSASRWKVFFCTLLGLSISLIFVVLLGVGLASGVATNPSWAAANSVSAGALITEGYAPLGAFGSFCAVVVALGNIANIIPSMYSCALSFQLLGKWFLMVPRVFWTVFAVVVYTVCACAGRNRFYIVFQDFLALMGYWTMMWVTLTLEEEFLFRRRRGGYNWADWNNQSKLPIGIAALTAFLLGWVGAVLSM
ncbi:MAG: hypothetical protein LQ347_003895 [Umbilicaria vellea]|nr:MAG: hypothetical protein LQ347_003895 [Umbilicaria vellea]